MQNVTPLARPARRFVSEAWLVRLSALLTALMGLVNLVSAIVPALPERLNLIADVSPLEVQNGSRLASALAGFALLLLAVYLWRRKQVAWFLTLLVLVVSAVSHLLKGLDFEEAGLAFVLAVGLLWLRPHFHARSDVPSVQQGLLVLASAFAFTLVYGVLGFYILDRQFQVNYDVLPALQQTVAMFTEFTDPGLEPTTGFGQYFADSIYAVAAVTFAIALWMLTRPVLVRQPATAEERARAGAIVEAHGRSFLARFTLFADKSYFFNPGGSVIAFVVREHVALALGDPIGPLTDFAAAIDEFKQYCARNDWQAAFYQTPPESLESYRAAGFSVLSIGQEAVVELAAFSLEGKAGKEFRTTLNKFNKLGYRAEACAPPQPEALLAELRAVSDEWLTQQQGRELRFATGWFEADYLRRSSLIIMRGSNGQVVAFASLVSAYQRNGLAVDLMRRRADAPPGTMDCLFVFMFDWAKQRGAAEFSLGLSALAGVGEHSADPVVERALRYLYENVNRYYNFKGLHAFKAKYRPRWETRYLVHPGAASLPAVATALVRASSGDDFLWRFLRP